MAWKPDYITAEGLRSYLRIDDSADDVFLALWATTVSRNVDDFCGRQFGKVPLVEAREYATVYDRHQGCWVAEIDDVQSVASMIVLDENATELDTYTLGPVNALQKGKPYERIHLTTGGPVTISALWGWTNVPSAVPTGAYLQAARLAARRDSPFGISGSPSEQGEIRLLAQLDPDFRTSLKPLVRNWWAA
ncbi:hypothetical protein ACIBSW_13155 [Actinoplanes sp. NPDC049668]|uniref:hypothetical protein n=1 Tax=unclassified Actinoplanes TaxID=2626549 RepID=UPI0033B4AC3D